MIKYLGSWNTFRNGYFKSHITQYHCFWITLYQASVKTKVPTVISFIYRCFSMYLLYCIVGPFIEKYKRKCQLYTPIFYIQYLYLLFEESELCHCIIIAEFKSAWIIKSIIIKEIFHKTRIFICIIVIKIQMKFTKF